MAWCILFGVSFCCITFWMSNRSIGSSGCFFSSLLGFSFLFGMRELHSYDSEMLNFSFCSLCILRIKSNKTHIQVCGYIMCCCEICTTVQVVPPRDPNFCQYCLSRNFFVSATKKEKRIRYRKTLFYRYLRCNLDILAQHAILLGWYIICTHKNDFGMQTKKRQRNFLLSNKRNIKCTLIQHLFLLYFASLWQYFFCTLRICHINRTKMPVERLLKRLNPFSLGLT